MYKPFRIDASHANPFGPLQVRDYSNAEVIDTFFPTRLYWDRLNKSHEVLLGTRGSGKTSILRMLSYRCLRSLHPSLGSRSREDVIFVGFYVPMHLEYVRAIDAGVAPERLTEYFHFCFNIWAAISLVDELPQLLADLRKSKTETAALEYELASHFRELWLPNTGKRAESCAEIQDLLRIRLFNTQRWLDGERGDVEPFSRGCLDPIHLALPAVNRILQFTEDRVVWMACIDEAEFLPTQFQRCLNTALRSKKGALVLKMATLPFKHLTLETLEKGISVSADGNDFHYRSIDFDPDDSEFEKLCRFVCAKRLGLALTTVEEITLEKFVGVNGDVGGITEIYRREVSGAANATDEEMIAGILESFDAKKRRDFIAKYARRKQFAKPVERYRTPFVYRALLQENKRGNRNVGLYAGAAMCRRVSDGNPRRFAQLLGRLFDEARQEALTFKAQQNAILDYCHRHMESARNLPEYGFVLHEILHAVCRRLHQMLHGRHIYDVGFDFYVRVDALMEDEALRHALELGVGYSHIFLDSKKALEEHKLGGVEPFCHLRLSHAHAAAHWLPMRNGGNRVLLSLSPSAKSIIRDNAFLYPKATKDAFSQGGVQLELKGFIE